MQNNKLKIYVFLSLFLVLIIDAMGIGLVVPLIGPLYINKTSAFVSAGMTVPIRDLLYGLTMAAFCIFMFFGAPFLGDLSDHIGRKKVLLICLFGTAVGLVISAIGVDINSSFWLIAGRGVAGFMCGSQALAQAAIVDMSTKDNKAKNLSLISFASCLGFALGPIMSGLVSNKQLWSRFSFATPFWFAAGLAILNGALLLFTFKETFYPKAKQRLRLAKGAEVFISAFTNKTIRQLAAVFLLAEAGFALFFQILPLYLITIFHYSTLQISYLMSWLGVIFAITLLLIIRIIEKYIKIEKLTHITLMLTALGIFMVLLKTQWAIWISIIPVGIGAALFYVALLTSCSNTVDENSQGWVMGVFAAVNAAAWALTALFSGILGIYSVFMPFIIAGGFLVLSTILYLFTS